MPQPIVEIFVGCSWAIVALSKIWGVGGGGGGDGSPRPSDKN